MPNNSIEHTLLADLHLAIKTQLGDEYEHLYLEKVVVGIFFIGVKLSNSVGGMCATPIKSIPFAVCCPSSAMALPTSGRLKGKKVSQVLNDLYRQQDVRRALAIAVLNALAETVWLRDGLPKGVVVSNGDTFDDINIKSSDKVALIGAFAPYIRELHKRQQDFKVLELDPSTLKANEMQYYAPADTAPEVLPWADVVVSTGTTMINGSIESLLTLLKPSAQVALVGPTVTLFGAPFFKRGVTHVGGTRVLNPDALLDVLAEGGSGYHFFEKTVERVSLQQSPLA